MGKFFITGIIVMLTTCFPGDGTHGRDNFTNDEKAYFGNATIKGKVEILNHPTLGGTEGRNLYMVFQRQDCRQCVIGIWTDADGNYQVHVSPGRYKLIVRDGTRQGETKDALAPNQQRIIEIRQPGTIANFNVEVVLPKD